MALKNPKTIKCKSCQKATVTLAGFTNTCDVCGADYALDGGLLAPREQWGEETGEHPADIARFDGMSADELLSGED